MICKSKRWIGAATAALAVGAVETAVPASAQWDLQKSTQDTATQGQTGSTAQPPTNTQSAWGSSTQVQANSAVQTKPKTAAGALNPSTGQSQTGVGTGQASAFGGNSSAVTVPDTGTVGEQNVTGFNGKTLGQQNPTGLNGKSLVGQQGPTGINGKPLGATASGGGGTADQNGGHGMHFNNGGAAGVSDDADSSNSKSSADSSGTTGSTDSAAADQQKIEPTGGGFMSSQGAGGQFLGKIWSHIAPDPAPSSDNESGDLSHVGTAGVRGFQTGEYDSKSGGRNATGQLINTGAKGGGDTGGGQTDQANGTPGANATGQLINNTARTGSDAPLKKPKDTTPLDANKLNKGDIDPKRDGAPSGG